jgi:chromo domain-containing protein 1
MSEVLRKDDLIAICYPVNPKPSVKYAWVAWSRGSPNFEFPPKSNNELPSDVEIPLLVAAHTMLPPIDTLGPRTSQSLDSNTPAISTDIPLINRIGLPGSRNTQGYERQLRRPIVQNDPMISGSFQPQNLLTSSKERPAATESDSYSRTDLVFLKQPGTRVDPKVLFKGLNELMNVEKLATIEDSGEPIKADYFFLHFPLDEKEAQEELIILKGHLEFHGKMVSTNLAPDGWAKFMRNSKMGVVIVCLLPHPPPKSNSS